MGPPVQYNFAEPWARQPFDGELAWSLFQQYLTLPLPRRLDTLTRFVAVTTAQLERIAFDDGWKVRAAAWDAHLDALRRQTVEQVVQEDARARAERQARQARKLARLGELEVDKLLDVASRPDIGPGILQPRDATRMIVLGVRTERLALGDVTDRVETGPDVSALSVEELRQLRDMQEKAERNRT